MRPHKFHIKAASLKSTVNVEILFKKRRYNYQNISDENLLQKSCVQRRSYKPLNASLNEINDALGQKCRGEIKEYKSSNT